MLTDTYGRSITYLRISVTDRCNFRCTYCMPPHGVPLKPHDQIMRYEDIHRLARAAAALGITKVRITGGEPLIRRNIEFLVKLIAETPDVNEVCMTTNGSLLTRGKALALKQAGLTRVNISLDSLDRASFSRITRTGKIDHVMSGIHAALDAGLTPVKINMVVFEDTTRQEIHDMRVFCEESGLSMQTIALFSLFDRKTSDSVVYDRPPRCSACNRIRLTADGHLKPCLFSDEEFPVNLSDPAASIRAAILAKPENGVSCRSRHMSQIGG